MDLIGQNYTGENGGEVTDYFQHIGYFKKGTHLYLGIWEVSKQFWQVENIQV